MDWRFCILQIHLFALLGYDHCNHRALDFLEVIFFLNFGPFFTTMWENMFGNFFRASNIKQIPVVLDEQTLEIFYTDTADTQNDIK